ncbi:hypothetical protein KP509_27G023000 [Ceratopteris richardii]|nr:hypothetical protein KP509_27G023000 [Ceratopteris richardii]
MEVMEATFRGRKLLGRTTELPPGYCGFFLEKESLHEGMQRRRAAVDIDAVDIWSARAAFKDITYWRHDDNPHSVSSGQKFLDWLQVASMMHKPVSAEEVLMEQNRSGNNGQKRKRQEI